MRNKVLGIIVPVLAGAAMVGTGFATWHFSEGNSTINGNVNLDGYTTIGEITIENHDKAVLNMDASDDTGITFEYPEVEEAEENKVAFSIQVERTSGQEWKALTLTTAIAFSNNVGSYVSLNVTTSSSDSTVSGTDASYNDECLDTTCEFEVTVTPTSQETTATLNLTTKLDFDWYEGKEPTSKETWSTLNSAIGGGNNVLSITYQVDYAE